MYIRKKIQIIFMSVVLVSFIFFYSYSGNTNDPYSIHTEKYYASVSSRWYNYSGSDEIYLNGPAISMDNPKLIARIKERFLLPPSSRTEPYELKFPHLNDTSMGQAQKVFNILGNKTEGFFVECGALDGETRSNTLYFERHLNWSGLLVEADPLNFAMMEMKKRKAYLSPSCLSIKPYPIMVSFKQAFNVGKISDFKPGYKGIGYVDVQCFPLYSYLLALNRTTVDYFSLDVEGSELEVLNTIPFEKLDIRTMSVEFVHVKKGKDFLREFVERRGYVLHSEVVHENNLANDFIFVKSPRLV
ncbi:protein Star-like isoform X2 [Zootermopsis nevadensis]|uniref:protein Star-like isoform X2 n=1 Tax=Zootermopsis nevadensis TaxID=136037 RepID=UPI000B8E37D9|nr:protein Star-like isoform X2 [Zootermopsis nevadensis]